jgi:DNA-binding winged helix-turn-helix (wHTH) protein
MFGRRWDVLKMIGRNPETVSFGEFRFVPEDGLWRHGRPVPLPPRALSVLTALLASAGTVVTKRALMDAAWPGVFVTESSLLEAIGLLRDALGDDRRHPIYIQTVHRRGYRFVGHLRSLELLEPVEPVEPLAPENPWAPIIASCLAYSFTTVCVAIVFALFGQERPGPHIVEPGLQARRSAEAITPAWTPSGLEIAFAFSKAGPLNLAGPWQQLPTSLSRDGQLLAYTELHPLNGADIWLLDRHTGTRRPLIQTRSDETWARFSPDGRSIAYMSNISGRWEVYVKPMSGAAAAVRLSSNGGAWPWWSDDGLTVRYSARFHGRPDLHIVLDWFSELAAPVRPS